MKTFKQHLTETIFPTRIQNYVFKYNAHFFPLSANIIKRVYGLQSFEAFHVLGTVNLGKLKKLEGTKKGISCFTTMKSKDINSGVVAGRGLVAKLKGDLLLKANTDIYSETDKQGRRWISTSKLPNLDRELDKYKQSLALMIFKERINIVYHKVIDGGGLDKKLVAKFIDMYISGCEKLLKKYIDEEHLLNWVVEDSRFTYDEIILNNIKILKVYIIKNLFREVDSYREYTADSDSPSIEKYVIHETGVKVPYEIIPNEFEMEDLIRSGKA